MISYDLEPKSDLAIEDLNNSTAYGYYAWKIGEPHNIMGKNYENNPNNPKLLQKGEKSLTIVKFSSKDSILFGDQRIFEPSMRNQRIEVINQDWIYKKQ